MATSPEQDTIDKYTLLMSRVKRRIDFLSNDWPPRVPKIIGAEIAAVQLRKLCEMVVFSSLVVNKTKYAELHVNYARHWRIKNIMEEIAAFHPHYFPIPAVDVDGHIQHLSGPQYLDESELIEIYNDASGILHADRPYAGDSEPIDQFMSTVQPRVSKFRNLLNKHVTHPFSEMHLHMFIVHMTEHGKNSPTVYQFNVVGPA